MTRGVYLVSLALAGLTLVLVLLSWRRPSLLRRRRLLLVLYTLAGTISLFALGDFSFLVLLLSESFLLPLLALLPWTLGWLLPLGLWLRYGLSSREHLQVRWARMRPTLVALYLPLVVCDLVTLVAAIQNGFYGLLAFFLGAHVVTIGYMQLTRATKERLISEQVLAQLGGG